MAIVYSRKIEHAGAFEDLGATHVTINGHDKSPTALVTLGVDSGSAACHVYLTPAAARETAARMIEAADAAEAQAVAA